jgi:hypothetical protein
MEHRWGERFATHIPIRLISVRPRLVSIGRITNLSRSGAFIGDFDFRLLSLIHVVLESPLRPKRDGGIISAYVARVCNDGIGVEWCEFGPPAVIELLRAMIIHTPEISRTAAPLLKSRS